MKKLLSLLLSAAMVFSLCGVSSAADDGETSVTDYYSQLSNTGVFKTVFEGDFSSDEQWKAYDDNGNEMDETTLKLVKHYYENQPTSTDDDSLTQATVKGTYENSYSIADGVLTLKRYTPSSGERGDIWTYDVTATPKAFAKNKIVTNIFVRHALSDCTSDVIALRFKATFKTKYSNLKISELNLRGTMDKWGISDAKEHEITIIIDSANKTMSVYCDDEKQTTSPVESGKEENIVSTLSSISFAETANGNEGGLTIQNVSLFARDASAAENEAAMKKKAVQNALDVLKLGEDDTNVVTEKVSSFPGEIKVDGTDYTVTYSTERSSVTHGEAYKTQTITASVSYESETLTSTKSVLVAPKYSETVVASGFGTDSISTGEYLKTIDYKELKAGVWVSYVDDSATQETLDGTNGIYSKRETATVGSTTENVLHIVRPANQSSVKFVYSRLYLDKPITKGKFALSFRLFNNSGTTSTRLKMEKLGVIDSDGWKKNENEKNDKVTSKVLTATDGWHYLTFEVDLDKGSATLYQDGTKIGTREIAEVFDGCFARISFQADRGGSLDKNWYIDDVTVQKLYDYPVHTETTIVPNQMESKVSEVSICGDGSAATGAEIYAAAYSDGKLVGVTKAANGESLSLALPTSVDEYRCFLLKEGLQPVTVAEHITVKRDTPTIHILGDSTVTDSANTWGKFLLDYFKEGSVTKNNQAVKGQTSYTQLEKGAWHNIFTQAHPGDYLLIQLGINDVSSASLSDDWFEEYMTYYVTEAIKLGMHPVLILPQVGMTDFTTVNDIVTSGKIHNRTNDTFQSGSRTLGAVLTSVSTTYNVPLINMSDITEKYLTEHDIPIYNWLGDSHHPKSEEAAKAIAKLLFKELKSQGFALANLITNVD